MEDTICIATLGPSPVESNAFQWNLGLMLLKTNQNENCISPRKNRIAGLMLLVLVRGMMHCIPDNFADIKSIYRRWKWH